MRSLMSRCLRLPEFFMSLASANLIELAIFWAIWLCLCLCIYLSKRFATNNGNEPRGKLCELSSVELNHFDFCTLLTTYTSRLPYQKNISVRILWVFFLCWSPTRIKTCTYLNYHCSLQHEQTIPSEFHVLQCGFCSHYIGWKTLSARRSSKLAAKKESAMVFRTI